jgi:hypothetical protein
LPYVQVSEVEAGNKGRNCSPLRTSSLYSWSPPDVWRTVKESLSSSFGLTRTT